MNTKILLKATRRSVLNDSARPLIRGKSPFAPGLSHLPALALRACVFFQSACARACRFERVQACALCKCVQARMRFFFAWARAHVLHPGYRANVFVSWGAFAVLEVERCVLAEGECRVLVKGWCALVGLSRLNFNSNVPG